MLGRFGETLLVGTMVLSATSCAQYRTAAPIDLEPPAHAASAVPEPARDAEIVPAAHQAESPPSEAIEEPPSPIAAEPVTTDWTLSQFEQLAMANNPTLRQAEAAIREARGRWLQAGLYPNPSIGYVGSEVGNDGKGGQQGGFVSQTIVTADKLDISRSAAAHSIRQSLFLAEAQRLRVLNEVRIRFITTLAAQRRVALAEELQRIAQDGVRISEQLYEAQQTARPDVLQAQLQLNEIQILLRNAQFRAEANWRQLANVAGAPHLPPQRLVGDLDADVPEMEWESAWQQLCAASPLLQAALAQVEQLRCELRREQVEPIPNVDLQAAVQQDLSSGDTIVGPQVGVTLPVFNRNQGNIAAATARLQRAIAEVGRLELTLRDQLADAFQRYESALNQVRLYREQILPTAQENLDLSTQGYRLGEFDLLRVLTARRSFYEANLAYVTALAELQSSAVAIQGYLLTGGLNRSPDAAADVVTPAETSLGN